MKRVHNQLKKYKKKESLVRRKTHFKRNRSLPGFAKLLGLLVDPAGRLGSVEFLLNPVFYLTRIGPATRSLVHLSGRSGFKNYDMIRV